MRTSVALGLALWIALAGAAGAQQAEEAPSGVPGGEAAGELVPLPPQPPGVPWPTEAWPEGEPGPGVDRAALAAAADALFAPRGRGGLPDTRALLVVHGGRLVLERYAEGFGPASRFHSWSMAKSVTSLLVGIALREGLLDLDAPAPVPAWDTEGDPRRALTLRHLLHMNTGLDNADGGSDPTSYAARLLFGDLSWDTAAAGAEVPLVHPPGTRWAYSTATSMLLARVVQDAVGGTRELLLQFLERELAGPLGVTTLVPEFDAAGTFLGGGFVWASARDWARLGLLWLRGGEWDGRRVLPEGYVDFARTPAPAENNGVFGAHLWLNREPGEDQFKSLPDAPSSAFLMTGANGQMVAMLPTLDLVIVRLGEMHDGSWPTVTRAVSAVTAAF